MILRHPAFLPIGYALACFLGAGCGSGKPVETSVPSAIENLRKISTAYLRATKTANRPPRNRDELMPFLEKEGTPSTILRSPEDGEEYIILWGVDYRTAQAREGTFPVLAYEQRGKGGKRYVLRIRDVVRLTEEELKKATFPPGIKNPF